MHSSRLARMLLGRFEKTAASMNPARWIWPTPSATWGETAARAAAVPLLPALGAGYAGAKVLGGVGRTAGKVLMRSAEEAPFQTAMIVGMPLAMGPAAIIPGMGPADPVTQQRAAERRLLAQQLGESQQMKRASALFSEEELREGLAIRRQLEKNAAKGLSPGKIIGDPVSLFMAGALLSAGAGAAGAGGQLASHLVGKGTEGVHKAQRDRHFKKVLKADPGLKREKMARPYFNVLHKASPYIATEPHVAAATLRAMIEAPEGYGTAPEMMRSVMQVEEGRQKTRFPALRGPSFGRGQMPGDMD